MPTYDFVVDTNQYAGNFEAELWMAVMGDFEAPAWENVDPMEECRQNAADMPFELEANPGWYNNGFGFEWRAHDEEGERQAIEHAKEHGGEAMFCPAYRSVAILFWDVPDPEVVAEMKARARAFAEHYDHGLEIEGFRWRKTEVSYGPA